MSVLVETDDGSFSVQTKFAPPGQPGWLEAPEIVLLVFASTADVLQFLATHNIEVVETVSSKKGDSEFIVNVPNPLGGTRYYCRFRDKKSCNDADVSAGIVQGQLRKLPLLFLSTGSLSKKAEEVLNSQQNILYKKVG